METRELKISANASGGTAAAGAKTYRITLPSSWVKKLDLDHADAKAEVVFDGTSIIIRPKAAEDILLFQSQALKAGHEVVRYEYFDQKNLCSTIPVSYTHLLMQPWRSGIFYYPSPIEPEYDYIHLIFWSDPYPPHIFGYLLYSLQATAAALQ